MRDNILTLGYKAQHPLKARVISFIAYIIALPLILILVAFITIFTGYKTFEDTFLSKD